MLQGQVTTDVTDPSPPNSTVSTYEIEDECPQIKNATHLCETGPWIIEGGARVRHLSALEAVMHCPVWVRVGTGGA